MSEIVDKTTENNGKKLGGITGKGFMPGQSGNPEGRPKGKFSLTVKQQEYYQENPDEFIAFLQKMRNEPDFWKKFWDKTDANPPQDFNFGGNAEFPIIVKVIKDEGINEK